MMTTETTMPPTRMSAVNLLVSCNKLPFRDMGEHRIACKCRGYASCLCTYNTVATYGWDWKEVHVTPPSGNTTYIEFWYSFCEESETYYEGEFSLVTFREYPAGLILLEDILREKLAQIGVSM